MIGAPAADVAGVPLEESLVIGAPTAGDGLVAVLDDAAFGEIQLFSGDPEGLLFTGPTLHLDDLIDTEPMAGDQFGYAMTAGDFDPGLRCCCKL